MIRRICSCVVCAMTSHLHQTEWEKNGLGPMKTKVEVSCMRIGYRVDCCIEIQSTGDTTGDVSDSPLSTRMPY